MSKNKSKIEIDNDLVKDIKSLSLGIGLNTNDFIDYLINQYKQQIHHGQMKLRTVLDNKNINYGTLELDAISNSLYDGLYIADGNGFTIDINKAFTRITGIQRKQLIGKHLQELVGKYFTKSVTLMVLEQKKQVTTMCTIITNEKKVLITGNPIFNEKGEIILVITNVRDITELIELKQKLDDSEKISRKYHQELELLRNERINQMGFIGKSKCVEQIKELILLVSEVDVTILITGETGVGKEIVAREIYKNSPRKKGPFIKVNCAAIPENLLESELFGYEKGAFTGAEKKEKLGMFELADGGTILLDEIGDLPLKLQSKLLRVLQEKEVTRIGGTKSIKLDVRVIAATNHKLREQVKLGKFREDLYYRLNVVPVKIPPLRLRKGDIPLLVDHFINLYNKKYHKVKEIDSSALGVFNRYDWPGNVRELENCIERLIITVYDKIITSEHLLNILDNGNMTPLQYMKSNNITLKEAVNSFERQIIQHTLKTYGSTRKAAKALGVSQPTIIRKSRDLGIKT